MKYSIHKNIIFCVVAVLLLANIETMHATYYTASAPLNIAQIWEEKNIESRNVSTGEVFIYFANYFEESIPESYTYTQVYVTWLDNHPDVYDAVQKLIYMWLLENKPLKISPDNTISSYYFYSLWEKFFGMNLINPAKISDFKHTLTTTTDLQFLQNILSKAPVQQNTWFELETQKKSVLLTQKEEIFLDVYKTLLNSHYDKETITEENLIESATIGLTKGTDDQFTTYFPPAENKDFMESLSGDFEWIGSYVEMEEPGVFRIISPISGSPSEKAGLKWGDIIFSVDGKKIETQHTINEVVSWIKWPKGTTVTLWVLRGTQELYIDVVRDTIVIENVEHKKLDWQTYYIKLIMFGENISGDFNDSLLALKSERGIKKLIIDVRNNPGGYLHEVSDMLGHFVPEWEKTIVVRSLSWEEPHYSAGYTDIDFSEYEIVILQNSWSASASEIMTGTIRDYLPNVTIIWEKSYGKGSVQTIKPYSDGSSLKYTIAKWYTWKTQTGIDSVGILPDIELEFDFDTFKSTGVDNQLEAAISY